MLGRTCFAVLSLALFAHRTLESQEVRVLVLDALNGKPQNSAEVHYLCQGVLHNSPINSGLTDSEGIATVPYQCKHDEKIILSAAARRKEQCGESDSLTLEDITSVGSVTPPDGPGMSCPTKISRKLKPVPGQVTIFVKKPSWLQSHF